MTFEVELKFRLNDEGALRQALSAFDVAWWPPVAQIDHYFNHPARDFSETDEALRLRQIGEQNVITYKGPKLDAATKTRREIELPIAGGDEGLAQFAQLLEALSFRPVVEVRKVRVTGRFTWQGWRVVVALDQVAGLGSFVELETFAEESQLPEARQVILSLAERLNLTQQERRGYLEMLLEEPPR